jgi:hypothetical protein
MRAISIGNWPCGVKKVRYRKLRLTECEHLFHVKPGIASLATLGPG